jgi:hypothetical protein
MQDEARAVDGMGLARMVRPEAIVCVGDPLRYFSRLGSGRWGWAEGIRYCSFEAQKEQNGRLNEQ